MGFSVYKVTNEINGKIYIGYTSLIIEKRFEEHKRASKGGSDFIFHKAIRKYGVINFNIIRLCWVKDKKMAEKLEKHFIKKLKANVKGIGYNMTDGGEGGKYTEETKKKHKKALYISMSKPEWKENLLKNGFNDEVKEKRKQSLIETYKNPIVRKNVSEGTKIGMSKPESKKRNLESKREMWKDEEWVKKQKALLSSPEIVEKRSKKRKETTSNPEWSKKQSEIIKLAWNKPGIREKYVNAAKNRKNKLK